MPPPSSGGIVLAMTANMLRGTELGPLQLQEGLHPSFWGEKAMRNCVRQAYNGGTPKGGVCTHGTGLNGNGEPNATLS